MLTEPFKYRRYDGRGECTVSRLSIVTAGHNIHETFDQIFADIKIGIDKAQKEKAEPVNSNHKEAFRTIERKEGNDHNSRIGT